MIKAAETNKTLHDSQWGCRPGRHALDAVPVDTRLSQPLSTVETWLSVVTPAFDAARMNDIHDSASDSAPDDDDPPD